MAHIQYKLSATSLSLAASFLFLYMSMPVVAQIPAEGPNVDSGDTLVIIGGEIIDGGGSGGGGGTIVGPPGGTGATPTPTATATATSTPFSFDTPVNTPTPVPGSYIILPPTSDQCIYGGTWTCGPVSECCVDTDGNPLACCVNSGF